MVEEFEDLTWQETFELLVEIGASKPRPDTLQGLVEGCQSRTWVSLIDEEVIGYSESAFINGVLMLIESSIHQGHPADSGVKQIQILDRVTPQRRYGLLSVLERYKLVSQGGVE